MTLVDGFVSWATALLWDFGVWRNSSIGFDISGLDSEATQDLTHKLSSAGVSYRVDNSAPGGCGQRRVLRIAMSHRRLVERLLEPIRNHQNLQRCVLRRSERVIGTGD